MSALHPRLTPEYLCGFGGRGDTEHRPTLRLQVGDGGGEHGGLAGTGRADDHHQPVLTGDGGGGVRLEHIEAVPLDRWRWLRVVELGVEHPGEDRFLLGEDVVAGDLGGDRLDPHRPTIRPPTRRVVAGGVQVDALAEHPLHRPIDGLRPPITGHPGLGAEPVGDDPEHIHAMPRRAVGGELLDHLTHRHPPRRHRAARAASVIDWLSVSAVIPMPAASLRPPCAQIGDTVAGLAQPGVRRRLPFQRGPFEPRRVATLTLAELVHLHRQRVVHLGSPFRELLQQLGRDAGDLGLAVHDLTEGDAVAVGELGPQHRLIQPAQRPLMLLQHPGIQREPAAVDGLHLGRDHQMGVQLRIIQPGRRLPERPHRQPLRIGMQPAAVRTDPGRRPEPLQIVDHRPHGDVVTLGQAGVAGQRPPHRQRLRRRHRRIKPGHRPHHPTIRQRPIAQREPERRPR